MTMTKSAPAAAWSLLSISSQGVSLSERLIAAKSCIRGAPSLDADADRAGTPGMTSIAGTLPEAERFLASSNTRPAMAYMPGSPLHMRAAVLPEEAASRAFVHRCTSLVMPVVTTSLPVTISSISPM